MSHQEQKEKTMQNASSVIHTGFLPDGDFYVGTEPPAGGFATDAGKDVTEEFQVLAVEEERSVGGFATDTEEAGMKEQQNPLSVLPQNIDECVGHPMWILSKVCVVCRASEDGGAVTSNTPLFNKFGCRFLRACSIHHAMVSAHFEKPEFKNIDSIQNTCSQCGGEIFSDRGGLCKPCASNWLDRF